MTIEFIHVDVFSATPYSGNSLAVFPNARGLSSEQMLRITQELRHFEAIFLEQTEHPQTVRARVFDLFGELPFAGHPIIGAAATLYDSTNKTVRQTWQVILPSKTVSVTTERTDCGYYGLLDQGTPEFLGSVSDRDAIAQAFNMELSDLRADLPIEVISTGLRYLVVPVQADVLERARIVADITELLLDLGAQFAVLLDETALEVRHWNNDGVMEDVATGSAAGVIGAYRLKHGLANPGEVFMLRQGRFTGRPSVLRVQPEGSRRAVTTVKVGGDVAFVGRGTLEVLP